MADPYLALPPLEAIRAIVRRTLEEDMPWGDVTTAALVPVEACLQARLVARAPGVIAGVAIAGMVFHELDPRIEFTPCVHDGDSVAAGAALALVAGGARPILSAERTALNLLQRMSGIATAAASYVRAVEGTRATIVDTRKTAPGLRLLDKYAVRCGGGGNHRFSLSDGALVKDNHLRAAGGDITCRLRAMRQALPHTTRLEVEVDRLDQIEAVLAGGADIVLLDNMSPSELRRAVELIGGRALTEASGGIDLSTVRQVAETGVDLISVGALTHSVRALDIGLDA